MKHLDHSYKEDFQYKHKNPYHDKLQEFSDFVFRDTEGEALKGKWHLDYFKNEKPLTVEVGCGYGEFMRSYTTDHPQENFVGIDYRFKRSYALAKNLSEQEIKNFCLLRAKGERLGFTFGENEISKLLYFFPDPWPKTRHHKKRLFQAPFIEDAYNLLKPGGKLFVKTDHDGYADWMSELINSPVVQEKFSVELESRNLRADYPEHFLAKYMTKFEKIFISQSIPIKAFVLVSKKV